MCFRDKKTKHLKLFSSDPAALSLDQLKISKKTEILHRFELTELVSRLKTAPKIDEGAPGSALKPEQILGREQKAKDMGREERESGEKAAEK